MPLKSRLYPAALSFFFLLFLLVPFLIFLFGPRKEISEAEKRKLADPPELVFTRKGLAAFPDQFDTFYRDHFGLRDHLIRWYNALSLDFFHVSPSDLVVAGRDGWFFYTGEGILEDYCRTEPVDPISLDRYAEILAGRRDWLAGMGISYLFVPIPNKIAVYDEYLPARIRRRRGISLYEQLMTFLSEDGRFDDIVPLDDVLRTGKETEPLYFKTDTHWSNAGALLAFNRIIEHCARRFPGKVEPVMKEEIVRKNVRFSGDLASLIHQENQVSESIDLLRLKTPCAGKEQSQASASVKVLDPHAAGQLGTVLIGDSCFERELTVLIIHDSFGAFLHQYFNDRFKKGIYSSYMKLDSPVLQDFIIREHPDIVLEIWVARNLGRALSPNPPEWTAGLLKKAYAASEAVRLRVDASFAPERIAARNQVSIKPGPEGLLLEALGDDPFFSVPFTPAEEGNGKEQYLVEVELDAPQDTLFALYFTLAGNRTEIRPQQQAGAKIHKGRNRILLRLPRVDIQGLLRIDPGQVSGQYLLRSLTVKAVSG